MHIKDRIDGYKTGVASHLRYARIKKKIEQDLSVVLDTLSIVQLLDFIVMG